MSASQVGDRSDLKEAVKSTAPYVVRLSAKATLQISQKIGGMRAKMSPSGITPGHEQKTEKDQRCLHFLMSYIRSVKAKRFAERNGYDYLGHGWILGNARNHWRINIDVCARSILYFHMITRSNFLGS